MYNIWKKGTKFFECLVHLQYVSFFITDPLIFFWLNGGQLAAHKQQATPTLGLHMCSYHSPGYRVTEGTTFFWKASLFVCLFVSKQLVLFPFHKGELVGTGSISCHSLTFQALLPLGNKGSPGGKTHQSNLTFCQDRSTWKYLICCFNQANPWMLSFI